MPAAVSPALRAEVARFRRFNRMYTRYLGALGANLHGSGFTLGEARVLYELGTQAAPTAGAVAAALDLDPGYLSRLLAQFERAGLVRRRASQRDARFADLRLTPRGRRAFGKLDRLADAQAQTALSALPPATRAELTAAMETIETILGPKPRPAPAARPSRSSAKAGESRRGDAGAKDRQAGMPAPRARPFVLRRHRVGDMGWVIHREAVGYAEQFGWDESFEALVAKIVADFMANHDPERERCWIAEIEGRHVGHVFLVQHPSQREVAKLRLLFVEPAARGLGIGNALVGECVRFARRAGYRKIVLWTQSMLQSAHRIYQAAGFRLVKEDPHHSFGHDLVGQEWELALEERAGASREASGEIGARGKRDRARLPAAPRARHRKS